MFIIISIRNFDSIPSDVRYEFFFLRIINEVALMNPFYGTHCPPFNRIETPIDFQAHIIFNPIQPPLLARVIAATKVKQ